MVIYRLRWPILALVLLFVTATAGYVVIEGYGGMDAAYMTVITLSTVGYGEVHLLDTAGRVFTMAVIVASFASFVYAATTLANLFTSGEALDHIRQAKGRRMRHTLRDHIIVIGFGRVGQAVALGVKQLDRPCLVIDRDPDRAELITEAGLVPLVGDATSEDVLREAGIERAEALVAAADQDDINLIVTLTARSMRRDLRIVARVNEAAWRERMMRAGATVAQSPYLSYGMTLAASAVTPAVMDIHDFPLLGLATEEVAVSPGSGLVGRFLGEVSQAFDVLVIGLRRDRRLHRWNEVDGPITAGDYLVALGTADRLRALGDAA